MSNVIDIPQAVSVRVFVVSLAVVSLFFATATGALAMGLSQALERASIATQGQRDCSIGLSYAQGRLDQTRELLGAMGARTEVRKVAGGPGIGGGQ